MQLVEILSHAKPGMVFRHNDTDMRFYIQNDMTIKARLLGEFNNDGLVYLSDHWSDNNWFIPESESYKVSIQSEKSVFNEVYDLTDDELQSLIETIRYWYLRIPIQAPFYKKGTFPWAIEMLVRGYRLRANNWEDSDYITMESNGLIIDQDGDKLTLSEIAQEESWELNGVERSFWSRYSEVTSIDDMRAARLNWSIFNKTGTTLWAVEMMTHGLKVYLSSWPSDSYIYMNESGSVVNEKGLIISMSTYRGIDKGWEIYHESEQKAVLDD